MSRLSPDAADQIVERAEAIIGLLDAARAVSRAHSLTRQRRIFAVQAIAEALGAPADDCIRIAGGESFDIEVAAYCISDAALDLTAFGIDGEPLRDARRDLAEIRRAVRVIAREARQAGGTGSPIAA